jgi:hypothetical protein
VVRGSEFSVRHSRTHAAEDDGKLAVGDVGFDLLEGTPGEERCRCAHKGDEPRVGKPGSHTHHVLFGNADVDQPVGKLVPEGDEVAGADRVIADGDDALIGASEDGEFVSERNPVVEHRRIGLDG